MRRHPKLRHVIKWVSTLAVVILLMAWIGSGWFYVVWRGQPSGYAAVYQGVFDVRGGPNGIELHPGWHTGRVGGPWIWWVAWEKSGRSWWLRVPFWVVTVPLLVMANVAWRHDALARRRNRMGLCTSCGYDRTSLAADVRCPECGTVPAK